METKDFNRKINVSIKALTTAAGIACDNPSDKGLFAAFCAEIMLYSTTNNVEEINVEKYVEIIDKLVPKMIREEIKNDSVLVWAAEHKIKGLAACMLGVFMQPNFNEQIEKFWSEEDLKEFDEEEKEMRGGNA